MITAGDLAPGSSTWADWAGTSLPPAAGRQAAAVAQPEAAVAQQRSGAAEAPAAGLPAAARAVRLAEVPAVRPSRAEPPVQVAAAPFAAEAAALASPPPGVALAAQHA